MNMSAEKNDLFEAPAPRRGRPPKSQAVAVAGAPMVAAPKSMLELIAAAAANPAVDVQKMKELLAIKREEDALESEREFNVALAEAQAEMPRLARDARSDKHRYLRLETVTKALDPIIAKHHFTLSFGMSDSPINEHYRITATLAHKSGHKREYFIDLPADTKGAKGGDNKTQVQGIGSTISYGRRYLTLMIFNVAVVNEDDDGAGGNGEPITREQYEELQQLIVEVGADIQRFLKHFKIKEVKELPASHFQRAKDALNAKRTAQ